MLKFKLMITRIDLELIKRPVISCELKYKLQEGVNVLYAGTSGVVSTSKKDDMPYTNAFIQELYRFRTMVPLGLMRHTTEDTVLEGYHLPKGTIVSGQ